MAPPAFAPGLPPGAIPVSGFAGQPAPQAWPPQSAVASPAAPRATYRGQAPEEPAPAPFPVRAPSRPEGVALPSPEQLGVRPATPGAAVDWTTAHRRLDRLGAVSFQLEKPAPGVCRFTCLLPTDQPGRVHHIEAEAATEDEAVNRVLAAAEEWAARR